MLLTFTKMHGLGNDFVVIDGVRQQVALTPEYPRVPRAPRSYRFLISPCPPWLSLLVVTQRRAVWA